MRHFVFQLNIDTDISFVIHYANSGKTVILACKEEGVNGIRKVQVFLSAIEATIRVINENGNIHTSIMKDKSLNMFYTNERYMKSVFCCHSFSQDTASLLEAYISNYYNHLITQIQAAFRGWRIRRLFNKNRHRLHEEIKCLPPGAVVESFPGGIFYQKACSRFYRLAY